MGREEDFYREPQVDTSLNVDSAAHPLLPCAPPTYLVKVSHEVNALFPRALLREARREGGGGHRGSERGTF